jgi:osmotically-inducible protein OsmY
MSTPTRTQSDARIQQDIINELKWDARVQPNEVGVVVKDGIVTLTGWVDSYTKRWVAERAAYRVRGVVAVANEIEIRLPTADQRTDTDIAAAAVRALEWDALVPLDKVTVTVAKGWVTIRGEVEWEFERREAENAIRRLNGVRGITNLVTVRPRATASVDDLKRKIEDSLVRSAETDAQRITVEVDGSKVTLRGTVRTWVEVQEAERIAWSAPGVTSVDNQIKVVF